MNLDTVFDIGQQPYDWRDAGQGLIVVLLLLVVSVAVRNTDGAVRRLAPRWACGFALACTLLIFSTTLLEWWSGRRALRLGTASVVEGLIEDFVPMPYDGHAEEEISVKGVRFRYSDYHISSAFKNTSSHGGPLRAGLHVRIHYKGNAILRLEVEKARGIRPDQELLP